MKFKKCKQTVDLSNYSVIIIFITTQDPFSILYIYRVDLWTFSDWLDGVKTSKIKEKKKFHVVPEYFIFWNLFHRKDSYGTE